MTDREQAFDLDTAQRLRARRSTDGVIAQYIRELWTGFGANQQ